MRKGFRLWLALTCRLSVQRIRLRRQKYLVVSDEPCFLAS